MLIAKASARMLGDVGAGGKRADPPKVTPLFSEPRKELAGDPPVKIDPIPAGAGKGDLKFEFRIVYCGLNEGDWVRSVVKLDSWGRIKDSDGKPGPLTWEELLVDEAFRVGPDGCTHTSGQGLDENGIDDLEYDKHWREIKMQDIGGGDLCALCLYEETRIVKYGAARVTLDTSKGQLPSDLVYILMKKVSQGEGCLHSPISFESGHRASWAGPVSIWQTTLRWSVPCGESPLPIRPPVPTDPPPPPPPPPIFFTSTDSFTPGKVVTPSQPWPYFPPPNQPPGFRVPH